MAMRPENRRMKPDGNATLLVNEIFHSIQGESSRAGLPSSFIRLTGCSLRCVWCDTQYAYEGGKELPISAIVEEVSRIGCRLVEITGGEPLEQANTPALAVALLDKGFEVMVETNGARDISALPDGATRIVDIKCPGSGAFGSFFESNVVRLNANDEIKFVVASRADFDWAVEKTGREKLTDICVVNISPAAGYVKPADAAEWILSSGLPFRLNLQLHKLLGMK